MNNINFEQGLSRIGLVIKFVIGALCLYSIYDGIERDLDLVVVTGQALLIFGFWLLVIKAIGWIRNYLL